MNSRSDRGPNVLGLCSTGHGAAIALVSPKYGVRALTLDRFTGRKHSLLFTRREYEEIKGCTTPTDLHINEALSFSYRGFPTSFIIEETFLPFLRAVLRGLPLRPEQIDLVVTSNCHFGFNEGRAETLLGSFFPNAQIVRAVEHHAIHQWQAFLPSPFKEAAVMTIDESGESLARLKGRKIAMSMSVATGSSMEVLHEHVHPRSSPGLMYADFSRHIGYYSGEEGKTMGLAPYGRDEIYQQFLPELKLFDDGSFAFLSSNELCARLNSIQPRRSREEPVEPVHADIAYAGQRILEDVLTNAMQALGRMTPSFIENVCLSGGVALNSCANEKIFRASRFKDIYISPNAGDDGHALACALYGARVLLGQPSPVSLPDDYLGPPYSDEEIERSLVPYSVEVRDADVDTVASMLAERRIVALFQNGSEYGPRALGNRSILADPRRSEMTDIVNERVKRRELFRPYAPVVLEEKVSEWFEHDGPSPFMLRVVQVRPDKVAHLGAVTHIDGSARLQTINRETNPRLYAIIEAFERRTGVPILLNTSFNVAGRPIVETPEDAIDCLYSTGLDALVAGKFLLTKPENGRGSEASASLTREMIEARRQYETLKEHAKGALELSHV